MASPPWLNPMLGANYFVTCPYHADTKKSECNRFCLDCSGDAHCSICSNHIRKYHGVVQIVRASRANAVRVYDIQKFIDISNVQTYVINGHKIVFLNARGEHKPVKGAKHTCEICQWSLLDPVRFCSLGCKFTPMVQDDQNLSFSVANMNLTENNDTRDSYDQNRNPFNLSNLWSWGKKKSSRSGNSGGAGGSNNNASPSTKNSSKRKGIPRRAPTS